MSNDNKRPLFQPDRRTGERREQSDRRTQLRKTNYLRFRGFLIAAFVFTVIAAIYYFLG